MWCRARWLQPWPLILSLALASGCFWDQDMVDQPSAKPQESAAPQEPDAIPSWGGESPPDRPFAGIMLEKRGAEQCMERCGIRESP